MRTSQLSFFFLFLAWSTACGLSVTGSNSSDDVDDGGRPTREGGAQSPTDATETSNDGGPDVLVDGAPPLDASNDAPNEGGDNCTVLVADSFAAVSPSWEALADATFSPGQVELTPRDMGARAGAIWWKSPLTFSGTLRVEVDFKTDSMGTMPGHGLAVAWIATSTPYAIGDNGQSFGLCNAGLAGVAVAADGRDSQLLAMNSVDGDCGTGGGVWPAMIGAGGKLVMELRTDSLMARYGAATGMRSVTAPITGYFGITAATGGSSQASHAVTSVRVSSCP